MSPCGARDRNKPWAHCTAFFDRCTTCRGQHCPRGVRPTQRDRGQRIAAAVAHGRSKTRYALPQGRQRVLGRGGDHRDPQRTRRDRRLRQGRARSDRAAAIEAALEQRSCELERANHAFESFSYSVAHDLRAPLRSVPSSPRRWQRPRRGAQRGALAPAQLAPALTADRAAAARRATGSSG